jgi:ComF family protein
MLIMDFIGLLFPSCCIHCKTGLIKGEEYLCTLCRYKLPKTELHLETSNEMERRFYGIIPLKQAFAYLKFVKSGSAQHLLHQLKYNNQQELGVLLGKWYGSELLDAGKTEFDLITSVPLHPWKKYKRGYNQADCFARGLSLSMEIEWSGKLLKRNINSQTQTNKSRIRRWKNVDQIFLVNNPEKIKDKNILLVDDVVTTGATLSSCGLQILANGCKSLSLATIAIAQ